MRRRRKPVLAVMPVRTPPATAVEWVPAALLVRRPARLAHDIADSPKFPVAIAWRFRHIGAACGVTPRERV
jgi:hypothetical protein